jgi:hypothetical protein
MRNLFAVCAFLAASTAALDASEVSELAPGTRVRLSVRPDGPGHPHTLRGTITALEPGALTVKPDEEATAVVLRSDQVMRLERLVKSGSRVKGAVIGAGVLGGAMLGLFLGQCSTDWGCEGADTARVVALIGGAAAVGALIGVGAAPGDRWREVRLGPSTTAVGNQSRLSLAPTKGGGVAASVALRLPSRGRH